MDRIKAQKLGEKINGKAFFGYQVQEYLGNGNSAAVYKGVGKDGEVAIKVFDNELVESWGLQVQKERIEREIALKGHDYKSLVKILNGGEIELDEETYLCVIMEYIAGMDLQQYIAEQTVTQEFIIKALETLHNVTNVLLADEIVHRDIKPANIMLKEDGEIILMDLGVIKIMDVPSSTDELQKQFISTVRYSPPEYLWREEENSIEGWRAVNLYQIGATMHDLIMGETIFKNKTPAASLILAVKEELPSLLSSSIDARITQLARDMLSKKAAIRRELCTDERIENIVKDENIDVVDSLVDEVIGMSDSFKEDLVSLDQLQSEKSELKRRREELSMGLCPATNECLVKLQEMNVISAFQVSQPFADAQDMDTAYSHVNLIYELKGSLSMGFSKSLYVYVKIKNDDTGFVTYSMLGIITHFIDLNVNYPQRLMPDIMNSSAILNKGIPINFRSQGDVAINFKDVFSGNVSLQDRQNFDNEIMIGLLLCIERGKEIMAPEVEWEIQWKKKLLESNRAVTQSSSTPGLANRLFNDF